VQAGGAVRIRCTVPRHPDNRWEAAGIQNYTESGRQMDGEYAPITREIILDHVPCAAGDAYCALQRADGRIYIATSPLRLSGCDFQRRR
jgi:hypothetical protein